MAVSRGAASDDDGVMEDSSMSPVPCRLLLVSPDLMLTSRVAGLVRGINASVETLRQLDAAPAGSGFDLVLLDLGGFRADPAVMISQLRSMPGVPSTATVAAFGPHVHRERLQQALDAGADHVVSRGELLGGLAALIARWCSPPSAGPAAQPAT